MRIILLLPLLFACAKAEHGPSVTESAHPRLVRTDAPAPAAGSPAQGITGSNADSSPVRFDGAGHPIAPLVLRNDCEDEDCETSFPAAVCRSVELRASPSDTARVVRAVDAPDTVKVTQRDLHVDALGVVVMKSDFVLDHTSDRDDEQARASRADTVRLARGDTLFLVRRLSHGQWRWAHHGRLRDSQQFWGTGSTYGATLRRPDSTIAVGRLVPTTEDWWFVQPRSGAPGWWNGDELHGLLKSLSDRAGEHDACPKPIE